MKQLFILIILQGILLSVSAQNPRSKVIEKRAREFHRVIGLNDQSVWKKFITENYSQAFIDKPMKSVVKTSDQNSKESVAKNIEEKAAMFQRLHQDFGHSKIVSILPKGEDLEMILESDAGLNGTFTMKFDKNDPYLINGLGIEVGR